VTASSQSVNHQGRVGSTITVCKMMATSGDCHQHKKVVFDKTDEDGGGDGDMMLETPIVAVVEMYNL
jgi:hypothetical protein